MDNFRQIIRHKTHVENSDRAISYIVNLETSDELEFECIIKPYKKSKTLEQLGYYWSAVIKVAKDWQGLTTDEADMFLKSQCMAPIYKEILGEVYEIRKSIAKMKVNEMREYIDDCINFLGINGQYVPPPTWRE